MKEHEIIERVYRSASIAFEIDWRDIRRIKRYRAITMLALTRFIDRKHLSDMFGLTPNYFKNAMLSFGYKLIRENTQLKTKYHFILNNCYN